jgi:hypothetical protein
LASDWVGKGGRARKLKGARIAAIGCEVGAVICVHSKGMSEAWCLATSISKASAREITQLYGQRWTIETVFRDTKDLRFGMGLSETCILEPTRRDRIPLVNALAINLLTLLGSAGESLGMDRHLKVNTTTRQTHSLFRQGCMLFDLIPNMPEIWLLPLITRFEEYLQRYRVLRASTQPKNMRGCMSGLCPHPQHIGCGNIAKWRLAEGFPECASRYAPH